MQREVVSDQEVPQKKRACMADNGVCVCGVDYSDMRYVMRFFLNKKRLFVREVMHISI